MAKPANQDSAPKTPTTSKNTKWCEALGLYHALGVTPGETGLNMVLIKDAEENLSTAMAQFTSKDSPSYPNTVRIMTELKKAFGLEKVSGSVLQKFATESEANGELWASTWIKLLAKEAGLDEESVSLFMANSHTFAIDAEGNTLPQHSTLEQIDVMAIGFWEMQTADKAKEEPVAENSPEATTAEMPTAPAADPAVATAVATEVATETAAENLPVKAEETVLLKQLGTIALNGPVVDLIISTADANDIALTALGKIGELQNAINNENRKVLEAITVSNAAVSGLMKAIKAAITPAEVPVEVPAEVPAEEATF